MPSGRIYEVSPSSDVPLLSKGYVQLVAGKTYRVTAEVRQSVAPGDMSGNQFIVDIHGLDASFNTATVTCTKTNVSGHLASPAIVTAAQGWKQVSVDVLIGESNTAAWGRSYLRMSAKAGSTVQVARLEIQDISESTRARGSADAAALSASSAAVSATDAGEFAEASQTSATNAATSAGNALTYSNNAASSATDAAGSASTATTQAGLAATSATNAGNSATAANTSAGQASTSATNAGNSATAANTSAVNAAASFSGAVRTIAQILPSTFEQDGTYFSPTNFDQDTGSLPAITTAQTGATFPTISGVGKVYQQVGGQVNRLTTLKGERIRAGATYRIQVSFRVSADSTNGSQYVFVGWAGRNSTGVSSVSAWLQNGIATLAGGWLTWGGTVTTSAILALNSTIIEIRPIVLFNCGSNGSEIRNGTVQFSRILFEDITESTNAASQASAAATSASNAAASATSAGEQATAASNSAVSASTSAGNASTSATNAATSATNAAGSANSASTSATVSATNASTANLHAAKLFPDRYDVSGQYFTSSVVGSPDSVIDLPSNATISGYGAVREQTVTSNTNADFATRQVLAATTGRVYKIEVEFIRTAQSGTPNASTGLTVAVRGLASDYSNIGATSTTSTSFTGSTQIVSAFFSSSVGSNILAWQAGSVWLRPYVRVAAGSATSISVQIKRLTISDVTESLAAATSASAAATSASNAATSETNAGTSATAASTSATNAATSAGNAQTFANNASTSATNASGSASTATTQAGVAATSALAAQSVANQLLPDRPAIKNNFVEAYLVTASPDASTPITTGSIVSVTSEGDVYQDTSHRLIATRGMLPVGSSRTFQVDVRSAIVSGGSGYSRRIGLAVYSASYAHLGLIAIDTITSISTSFTEQTGQRTTSQILAAFPTAAYIRAYFQVFGGTSPTWQVGILRLKDMTEVVAAANSASAAATSASNASTSATNAGNSATAANTSATNAATSAGNAQTYANNASTSADNAAGSAASATTQAGVAATSSTVTQQTAASTLPYDFSQDGLFWTTNYTVQYPASITANANFSFPTVSGIGKVAQITIVDGNTPQIFNRGYLTLQANRTYRWTSKYRIVTDPGGVGVRVYMQSFHSLNANFVYDGSGTTLVSGVLAATATTSDGWVTRTLVFSTNSNPPPYWRGFLQFTNLSNGVPTVGTVAQVSLFKIEDITESTTAAGSAAAAATSASNASTSATNAGTSATAANTSATNAATSAGNAQTYANNASTSADNAAGSAASATTQAGVAATSAAAAQGVATLLIPDRPSVRNNFVDDYATTASPNASVALTAGSISSVAIEGDTFQDNTARLIATRGMLPVGTGRTIQVDSRSAIVSGGSGYERRIGLAVYSSSYAFLGLIIIDSIATTLSTFTNQTGQRTSAQILTDFPTAAYVRGYFHVNGATPPTWRVSVLRLRDVSEAAAAANSASAAATSAANANTSATNAGNSATAANSSAVTASAARDASHMAVGVTFPGDFTLDGALWTDQYYIQNPRSLDGIAGYSFTTVSGVGRVAQIDMASSLFPRVAVALKPNRRYRWTVIARLTTAPSSGTVTFTAGYDYTLTSSYSVSGEGIALNSGIRDGVITTANGWVTRVLEFTTSGSPPPFWRGLVQMFSSGTNDSTYQVSLAKLEDITESYTAAQSATAAATSASNAAASATSAGEQATASSTSALNASTSAGQALTSATNAATSETNAAGSANSASISSTAAASARFGAEMAGSAVFPGDFAQDGAFFTTDYQVQNPSGITIPNFYFSFTTVSGVGRVLQSNHGGTFFPRAAIALKPNRRYRWTVRARLLTAPSTGTATFYTMYDYTLNSDYMYNGGGYTVNSGVRQDTITTANGWVTRVIELTTNSNPPPFWRPAVLFEASTSPYDGTMQFALSKVEDITESYSAGQSASAAATSASNASASATTAGERATAASTSATNAATSAGQASTSAANAATSETNAAGSANSASTSSSVASNARLAAEMATSATFPGDFSQDGAFFTANYLVQNPPAMVEPDPLSLFSFATVSGIGRVLQLKHNGIVHPRAAVALKPNRRYRWTVTARLLTAPSTGTARLYTMYDYTLNSNYTFNGGGYTLNSGIREADFTTGDGWITRVIELTTTASPPPFWRPAVQWLASSSPFDGLLQVSLSKVEDITESYSAAQSASAAATSASTASTQATNAGTSATAAQNSATSAATSAGNASTSATNAATSATNAQGSANSASSSATVSATNATNANLSAAKLFPDRYDGLGQYFTAEVAGSPSTVSDLPSNATMSGYGPVREQSGGDMCSRQVLPAVAGRVYKVEVELIRTAQTGTPDASTGANISIRALGSDYSSIGASSHTVVAFTGSTQIISGLFSSSAGTNILAWTASSVWIRPYVRVNRGGATSIAVQIKRLTITDVTESLAAAGSASAAATSASSASTSATNAGNSATAANSSSVTATAARDASQAARDASQMAVASLVPGDFALDGALWTDQYGTQNPRSLDGVAGYSFTTVSGVGRVVQCNMQLGVHPRAAVGLKPNRRYRWTVTARLLTAPTSGTVTFFAAYDYSLTSSYAYSGAGLTLNSGTRNGTITTGDGWVTRVLEFTTSATPQPFWRGLVQMTSSGSTDGNYQISLARLEDITESYTAAQSASAAATSASNAAASATTAGEQATAASTSATNAATSASNASTFATNASTSATNAAGSASTATTQAGVATSASNAARDSAAFRLPSNFYQDGLFFHNTNFPQDTGSLASITTAQTGATFPTVSGIGKVYQQVGGQVNNLTTLKGLRLRTGATYRIQLIFRVSADASNGTQHLYVGWTGRNSAGSAATSSWLQNGTISVAGGWLTWGGTVTTTAVLAANSTVIDIRPMVLFNCDSSGSNQRNGTLQFQQLLIEDITESTAAAGSATAAATSASNASTSATNAGISATAASTSATNAGISAGNAATSATNAQTSESNASTSAASALASQTLAASVSTAAINPNPIFANWANPSSYPDNWSSDVGTTTAKVQRITGENGYGYALRFTGDAGTSAYLGSYVGSTTNPSVVGNAWYMIEADVRLKSGTFVGSGVYINYYDSSNALISGSSQLLIFSNEGVDGNYSKVGNGVVNTMYRFRKSFQVPANAVWFGIYVATHSSTLGSIASANQIDWHRCAIRSLSEAERSGHQALAQVNIMAGAVARLSEQSAFWGVNTAVAGSGASAFLTVRADQNNPAAAPVTPDRLVNCSWTIATRTLSRSGGTNTTWGHGFTSTESYTGEVYCAASNNALTTTTMFGLTDVSSSTAPDYTLIDYAIYIQATNAIRVYESGSDIAQYFSTHALTDVFSIEYNGDAGGTVIYKRNGTAFRTVTGIGTGRTFRFMADMHHFGSPTSSLTGIVLGSKPPSTTSSVAIGAQEIVLSNTTAGVQRIALKLANGDAAFSGNIYAGGKIIMGNGNTGWEVAVKPKIFNVKDGDTVAWANLGYIPSYVFNPIGLAPLAAGETYSLYLENPSATGGIARLKINVPGTSSSHSVTTSSAGGSGAPTRVMSKGSNPDATNGLYRFSGYVTNQTYSFEENMGFGAYANHNFSVVMYGKISGTWTTLFEHYISEYIFVGSTGYSDYTFYYTDIAVTAPAGITDFGITAVSYDGGTVITQALTQVAWTSPGTASSVRTASPSNETCVLTVTP